MRPPPIGDCNYQIPNHFHELFGLTVAKAGTYTGRMMRGRLAVSFAACAIMVVLADSGFAQAGRRTMFTSVLDSTGVPVQSVNPDDLVVREDKVIREVLETWPATEPMDIALLVDNSSASEPLIRDYREALQAFITGIAADETGAKHQIAVITLADRPTIKADYRTSVTDATKAVASLFSMPESGTYLLDGIIESSKGLAKRSSERAVIVAITTEGPELSGRQYQSVLEPLRASGAALHAIVVGRPQNNNPDRVTVLGRGTKESGGSYDNILSSTGLTARMKKLAAELTHQFKVTYSRPESLIPPKQVTISGAKSGLTVRGAAARVVTQERR